MTTNDNAAPDAPAPGSDAAMVQDPPTGGVAEAVGNLLAGLMLVLPRHGWSIMDRLALVEMFDRMNVATIAPGPDLDTLRATANAHRELLMELMFGSNARG